MKDIASGPLVLLTGASGFIGTRVRSLLLERGYRLRVLSRRPDKAQALAPDWCVGDLTDVSACRQAMDTVQVVIHAAGAKRDAAGYWPVNVQGTENLLAAAAHEGVRRFVHISSVGVIGADPLRSRVCDEDTPCTPGNDYERSKWAAEKLVCQAGAKGVPVAVLRPANVFGDRDPERNLLTLIRTVRDGRFVYLGGRSAMCNYVFVEDVAHACLALAEDPKAVGRVYHLSDSCLLGEFVDTLADELGVARPTLQPPALLTPLIRTALRALRQLPGLSQSPVVTRLVSLNNQARFATTRLADELGFRCPVGWRAGVSRVVRWYRAQGEL